MPHSSGGEVTAEEAMEDMVVAEEAVVPAIQEDRLEMPEGFDIMTGTGWNIICILIRLRNRCRYGNL